MRTPTGEVLRTIAPLANNNFFRMYHGGQTGATEAAEFFSLAGAVTPNLNFHLNAPNGEFRLQTTNVTRVRLLQTLANQLVNGYTVDLSGNFGIGRFSSGPVNRPLCLLHVDSAGTQDAGYRPWMKVGLMLTIGSDLAYFGLKREPRDQNYAVIQWADNNTTINGPDCFRWIFTRNNQVSDTASSENGLECGRIVPLANGNESHFGIGDFRTAGVNPSERLHVHDGTIRIDSLVPDHQNDTLVHVLVADTNGVVHWRDAATLTGTGSGCDWEVDLLTQDVYTAWRPNGSTLGCPEEDDQVGIGTPAPTAKFHVRKGIQDAGDQRAIFGQVGTGGATTIGVDGEATGGAGENDGLRGYATNAGRNIGAKGVGVGGSTAWGLIGTGQGAYSNYGASVSGTGGTNSIGLQSTAVGGSTVNYGLLSSASGTNAWAAWFNGNVNMQGGSLYGNQIFLISDAAVKQDEADEPDALSLLGQLNAKTYTFIQDIHPEMGLPSGLQHGFIAPKVEEVMPELVSEVTVPALIDDDGAEVHPSYTYKALNYIALVPVLVAGLNQQQATIVGLQEQVAALQSSVAGCCGTNADGVGQRSSAQAVTLMDLSSERLSIDPNPFTTTTALRYYLPAQGRVKLEVANDGGARLAVLREELAVAGEHTYLWNASHLPTGLYFVSLIVDERIIVKKAVKID